jgi:hypothetical protein
MLRDDGGTRILKRKLSRFSFPFTDGESFVTGLYHGMWILYVGMLSSTSPNASAR